jgi:glucokinase
MNSPSPWLLGLDLGATRLKALCVTADGREIARDTSPSNGPDWRESAKRCVASLLEKHGQPDAVGVAAPGLPSRDERCIARMPERLAGLEGLDWREFLGFSKPIPVLNDAHAALLGEVWMGAAKGRRDVIMLTLGTGVGGAVLSDGRLMRGHSGRAGHFGHISIRADGPPGIVNTPGSLEDAVGNHSLPARSGGRFHSTFDLVAAAKQGDADAALVWDNSIRDLAAGITSLINVFDPELVVLGGGICEAGDDLFVPLAREMERVEWRPGGHCVPIVRATLGEWAGTYGAAARTLNSADPSLII